MTTHRRARELAGGLYVWLQVSLQQRSDIVQRVVDGLGPVPKAGGLVRAFAPAAEEPGLAFVITGLTADEVHGCWTDLVTSAHWPPIAAAIECQPAVNVFSMLGHPWRDDAGPFSVVEVTAAEHQLSTHVPSRAELPAIEGADLWPVLGHPGRLIAKFEAGGDEPLDALLASWPGQRGGLRRWSGLEKIAY